MNRLRLLNFDDLFLLEKLLEDTQITALARQMGLAQPAISQRIRKIERVFEVAILQKADRRVRLTDEGRALCSSAISSASWASGSGRPMLLCPEATARRLRLATAGKRSEGRAGGAPWTGRRLRMNGWISWMRGPGAARGCRLVVCGLVMVLPTGTAVRAEDPDRPLGPREAARPREATPDERVAPPGYGYRKPEPAQAPTGEDASLTESLGEGARDIWRGTRTLGRGLARGLRQGWDRTRSGARWLGRKVGSGARSVGRSVRDTSADLLRQGAEFIDPEAPPAESGEPAEATGAGDRPDPDPALKPADRR